MQSLTWPRQVFQNHVLKDNDKKLLTSWQQECPNCGEMSAISPFQYVHEVNDSNSCGNAYAQISTVCTICNQPMTEIWSIN
jgi:hypothetical protein